MNKSILDVVHDTAKGLKDSGLVDTKTMREFDVLCLPPVKIYNATQIKRIRVKNIRKELKGSVTNTNDLDLSPTPFLLVY